MASHAAALAPVPGTERISSVDTIRGVAVLGILLMNIVSFGLPAIAYDDPTLIAGGGINDRVWFWNTVLFEGKMRALFSMLFGAGLVIMTARAEARSRTAPFADIYLRRNLWLTAIGILHAFFLWEGDILYMYGLCGLLLFTLRGLSPKILVVAGLALMLVLAPKSWLEGFDLECKQRAAAEAEAAKARGEKLTADQEAAIGAWKEKLKERKPGREELDKQIKGYQGGYWTVFLHRHLGIVHWQSSGFYLWAFWDVAGMMLIGMALMKLGIFSAARAGRVYAGLALMGFGAGLPLSWWLTNLRSASNFDPIVSAYASMGYEPARVLVAFGYVGLLGWLCRVEALPGLRRALANVGRMALTNYLLASLIASTVFYGYGFGLFGKLERYQLYFAVAGTWAVQLILSALWLRHFEYGPVEWAWRSLTYWRRQPFRLRTGAPEALAAEA